MLASATENVRFGCHYVLYQPKWKRPPGAACGSDALISLPSLEYSDYYHTDSTAGVFEVTAFRKLGLREILRCWAARWVAVSIASRGCPGYGVDGSLVSRRVEKVV